MTERMSDEELAKLKQTPMTEEELAQVEKGWNPPSDDAMKKCGWPCGDFDLYNPNHSVRPWVIRMALEIRRLTVLCGESERQSIVGWLRRQLPERSANWTDKHCVNAVTTVTEGAAITERMSDEQLEQIGLAITAVETGFHCDECGAFFDMKNRPLAHDHVSALLAEVKRLRALELRWTTERPAMPGRYWAEVDGYEVVEVVKLCDDLLTVEILGVDPYEDVGVELVKRWSGPIPEPKP